MIPFKTQPGLAFGTVNYANILNSLKRPPIMVNDLDTRYPEDEELLNKYLMTNYDTATYSMVPQCDCGKLIGGYLRGKVCPHCNSEVLTHTEIPIESNLWMRVPEGVHAFISPIVYAKLSQAFESNKVDIIRWICDVHYKANFNDNIVIHKLRDMGIKRGYNNFVENFWEYLDLLLTKRVYTSVSDKRNTIKQWLLDNKENIFTPVLMLPNRLSLITEKTPTGRYGEVGKFGGALEAAKTMASLNTRIDPPTQLVKESTTIKVVMLLALYGRSQYKLALGKKEGLIRKHICGTRMPFTARNVITSLHSIHNYDELSVPWAMAIGLLQLHLTNKFLRDGYTPNEAAAILTGYINRYHPLIRQYFDELLAECPYKGLPVCFNRNPTLLRASIQQFYITEIKNDLSDNSISLSVLVLSGFNADFDGDQMNLYLNIDRFQHDNFKPLASHTSVWSMENTHVVSGMVNLPKPVYSTLNNFLNLGIAETRIPQTT